MEDLSNTALISTFISLLIGAVGTVFGLYKKSEIDRAKEREESMAKLIAAAHETESKQRVAFQDQIIYQQKLIDSYKKDLDELNDKYFELASTLLPALQYTNKTLEDLSKIITKI
jgi:hypothetical protein